MYIIFVLVNQNYLTKMNNDLRPYLAEKKMGKKYRGEMDINFMVTREAP